MTTLLICTPGALIILALEAWAFYRLCKAAPVVMASLLTFLVITVPFLAVRV